MLGPLSLAITCVLGVSTAMLWRQTRSLDARLAQLEGSRVDLGVVNTTLWRHVQGHNARLVRFDGDLQELREHVDRAGQGQSGAWFGGGGGGGGGVGGPAEFDSEEEVSRRRASVKVNNDNLPGVSILADEDSKTLKIGGSLDVAGDVVFRGRLFIENFTKIFSAPSPAPTFSAQPSSMPTIAVCPAIDVAASATTAGASCAGGAASGGLTCGFACASGYAVVGSSSTITCGVNGE